MKSLIDKVVAISFLDHAQHDGNSRGVIPCIVYGRVFKSHKTHFEIIVWDLPDCDDGSRSHNQEMFSILKSTIVDLIVFGKGKKVKKF